MFFRFFSFTLHLKINRASTPLLKSVNFYFVNVYMKKLGIILIFFLFGQAVFGQNYLNKIGFDFENYMIKTPKYNLPGNHYNPYMASTGGGFGFFYERHFKNRSFSLKTGGYLIKQFGSAVSVNIPVDFNGNILGKSTETTLFLGYTAGFSMNIMATLATGSVFYPYEGKIIAFDISYKKHFYIAPHVGLNAGMNISRFCFTVQGLYDFFVPEFVNYKTVYKDDQGKEVTEYNTNNNWGLTFRFGLAYRF